MQRSCPKSDSHQYMQRSCPKLDAHQYMQSSCPKLDAHQYMHAHQYMQRAVAVMLHVHQYILNLPSQDRFVVVTSLHMIRTWPPLYLDNLAKNIPGGF